MTPPETRGPHPGDVELLRQFLSGEAAACRKVERWAWEVVYFKHYAVPPDEREDVVQEAVAAIWRAASRPGFALRSGLRPFVRQVAAARAIDRLRRLRPTVELDEATPDPAPGPYDLLLARDQGAQVKWAIQNASPSCQEIIRLHYFEGLTYGEIAARLERAEATLRVRMFNCMKAIRKAIERFTARPPLSAPRRRNPSRSG